MKKRFRSGAAAAALLTTTSVFAQVTGPQVAAPTDTQSVPAKAASDSQGLAEIIVTAQRRSENLQRAAIAITAVGAEKLVRDGVADTTQLTQVAPSLQVGSIAGSANTFYLRGVGNFTTNSVSDAAVSFNVDGVPFARSQSAQAVFYDLERVEVVKGPQGILYGRNSTGGAINVITAKPQIGVLGGFASAEYGNYDAYKLNAALNVPLGDQVAARVSGYLSKHDGYYSDGTGDDDTRAIRGQVAFGQGGSVRMLLSADYAAQKGVGSGSTVAGFDRDKRIGLLDPRAGAAFSQTYSFLAGNFLHPLPGNQFPAYNDNSFWGVHAQADVDTPFGTLTIIPSYRKTLLNQRNYGPGFDYFDKMKSQQTSIETRLASNKGRGLDYLIGFFFLDEKTLELPIYDQQYFSSPIVYDTHTKSYAGFGQLTYHVTDRLRLTGGARYTVDDKSALIDNVNLLVVCPAAFAGGSCPGTPAIREDQTPSIAYTPTGQLIPVQPYGTGGAILTAGRVTVNPQKTFRKPTFRGGVEYDLAPHSLLYANVETGFKSGGFFSTIGNPVYLPETITAYTIGSKNSFDGNRIQVNFEGFYWNYKNQQVFHLSTNQQGGIEFVTDNVGKTRIWGGELETRFRVMSNTTLSGTIQYLNAKYKDFVYASPVAAGAPITGCPVSGPNAAANFLIDCSGRQSPNSPKWVLSGSVEQIIPIGTSRITLNVDARYQSGTYTGFEQLPSEYQPGYAMVNAQLRYDLPGIKANVSVFANNLFDKQAAGFSLPVPQSGGALVVESLRPPRTYGVRVRYDF